MSWHADERIEPITISFRAGSVTILVTPVSLESVLETYLDLLAQGDKPRGGNLVPGTAHPP